jgi:RNA polymerase sigma factor (sigma-70 family)
MGGDNPRSDRPAEFDGNRPAAAFYSLRMSEVVGRIGPDSPAGGERSAFDGEDAVVSLWRAHRRWVAAVVYAHKPRDVDVDDLLQEVAMKLVRNIHRLNDASAVRPWLRTVAVNVARSAGRSTRARTRVVRTGFDAASVPAGAAAPTTSDSLALPLEAPGEKAGDRGRRALELASSLPPHYREPLLLSLRGLSQKQIAEAMDIPVTTIETRLIRARRMVRDELMNDDTGRPRPRSSSAARHSGATASVEES